MVTKYRQQNLIVFCPKNHPQYETIKRELFRARQEFPLNTNPENSDDMNTIFILTTTQKLIPMMILKSKEPMCIYTYPSMKPENDINLLTDDKYLKHLKKIDGMTIAQFQEMVNNPEAQTEGMVFKDKEDEEEKREQLKAKYSPD